MIVVVIRKHRTRSYIGTGVRKTYAAERTSYSGDVVTYLTDLPQHGDGIKQLLNVRLNVSGIAKDNKNETGIHGEVYVRNRSFQIGK